MPKRLLLCFAALGISFNGAWAIDFYVSPAGDDQHDGSAAAPFATVVRARDEARMSAATMTSDIHIWLADGIYPQSAPLIFEARDSGQNNYNIIYEAAPGAHPQIVGGRQISGWTQTDAAKNIWSTPAPDLQTRQLYINGVRANRARSSVHPLEGAKQDASGYILPGKSPLVDWSNPDQIEFVYNFRDGGTRGAQWVEPRLGVQSITFQNGQTTIVMKQPGYADDVKLGFGIAAALPNYAENVLEFLQQPGDWYLDSKKTTLYYIPRPGEDLATAQVVAPMLETLVSGAGSPDAPLHNLDFTGITFAYATWLRPSSNSGFPEVQAGHFPDNTYTPGNILFQHAHHLRFERCTFAHLGGAGLELSHGVQDVHVIGCHFTDISATGLVEGTTDDPLRAKPALREENNAIEDCSFENVACEYHGATAILCGYVSHSLIAHNEIRNVPYTAISIGWGWGAKSYAAGNRVLENKVDGFSEMMGDGGAIYTQSPQPDSEIAGNYFLHQGTNYNGGTIYPDEGTMGFDIHDNVIDNVFRWLFIWTSSIKNLHIHDNWTTCDVMENKGTNISLAHNTVVKGPWPVAAQSIIDHAGLEPAWQGK